MTLNARTSPLGEFLKHPREVVGVDLAHGVTVHALLTAKRDDIDIRVPAIKMVGKVHLGADGPRLAGVGLGNSLADRGGRPDDIRRLNDLVAALGVDNDVRLGAAFAEVGDVLASRCLSDCLVRDRDELDIRRLLVDCDHLGHRPLADRTPCRKDRQ